MDFLAAFGSKDAKTAGGAIVLSLHLLFFDGLRTKVRGPKPTCQLARLFYQAGRPVCQAGRPLGGLVFCLVRELLVSVAVRVSACPMVPSSSRCLCERQASRRPVFRDLWFKRATAIVQ